MISKTMKLLCLIVCPLWICGCQAHRMGHEGKNFRQALLDMYTDQAMDNLVRARNNMPFVQMTYRDLLIQETDIVSGGISTNQASTNNVTINGATPLTNPVTFLRGFVNTFNASGTASRQGLMSFYASPVTNQNEVYDDYIKFARNPILLRVTDAPPKCPVHLMRKCNNLYYWIPVEAGPQFLDLVMTTTFQRGDPATTPTYYEVQVLNVKPFVAQGTPPKPELTAIKKPEDVQANVVIFFDRKVPNGSATLVITLKDGRKVKIEMNELVVPTEESGPVKSGAPIDLLRASWKPSVTGYKSEDLLGCAGRLHSNDHPRDQTKVSEFEQRTFDVQDLNRANNSVIGPRN